MPTSPIPVLWNYFSISVLKWSAIIKVLIEKYLLCIQNNFIIRNIYE